MRVLRTHIFPILLTLVTFVGLSLLLFGFIQFLDILPIRQKLFPHVHLADILIGFTIYIKTAIDFAIFIGNLMSKFPGIKNRIAIEMGTSFGNFIGTLCILSIWAFFKEIPLLLFVMIVLAALVLLGMAQEGLEDFFAASQKYPRLIFFFSHKLFLILRHTNTLFHPLTKKLLPKAAVTQKEGKDFSLFWYATTIPLILGLDDFAGYIPLFTVVNVFGFALGVFFGHMLLTASLFTAPRATTKIVRLPLILLLGSVAFIGIALWGFVEAGHILLLTIGG